MDPLNKDLVKLPHKVKLTKLPALLELSQQLTWVSAPVTFLQVLPLLKAQLHHLYTTQSSMLPQDKQLNKFQIPHLHKTVNMNAAVVKLKMTNHAKLPPEQEPSWSVETLASLRPWLDHPQARAKVPQEERARKCQHALPSTLEALELPHLADKSA